MLEVFLKRLQVVSVMEQLIGNRVHEWGLLTSGFGSGVTGGGGNLVIYGEHSICSVFYSQFFYIGLLESLVGRNLVVGNKLTSSIQKPSLQRAGSVTVSHEDFLPAACFQ